MNYESPADLARKALDRAWAAQRKEEAEPSSPDPAALAEKLRGVAGDDGRLTVREAVGALTEPAPDPADAPATPAQQAAVLRASVAAAEAAGDLSAAMRSTADLNRLERRRRLGV